MLEMLLGKRRSNASADPYWKYVSLLMHMDGAEGSQIVKDEKGHNATMNGGAIISATNPMYGTGSAYFPGVPNTDFIAVDDAMDLTMEYGAFTIEMFVQRQGDQAQIAGLYYQRNSSALVFCLYNNCLALWSGGWRVLSSTPLPDGVPTHVAVVRDENHKLYLMQGGKVVGSSDNDSTYFGVNNGKLYIGGDGDLGFNQPFKGKIDEVRVTKGIARYPAADMVAPVGPFPGLL